eukprot:345483-Chlamydomonas_euryale.AAC.11
MHVCALVCELKCLSPSRPCSAWFVLQPPTPHTLHTPSPCPPQKNRLGVYTLNPKRQSRTPTAHAADGMEAQVRASAASPDDMRALARYAAGAPGALGERLQALHASVAEKWTKTLVRDEGGGDCMHTLVPACLAEHNSGWSGLPEC